jgi:hypothetical protein
MPTSLRATPLALAAAIALTAGCASMGAGRAAPTPRYIDLPCTLPGDRVVARARDLLQQNGWQVTLVAVQPPEVEASRAAVYSGAGENLIASGPYRFDLTYPTGVVRMLVETVRVYPDGRAEHARYHGEDSPLTDRRLFEGVITGMREFCAGR